MGFFSGFSDTAFEIGLTAAPPGNESPRTGNMVAEPARVEISAD